MDMEVLDLKSVKGERHTSGFFEREVRYLGSHVLFAARVVSFIVMRGAFMSWVSSTLPLWTKCNRYAHVVFGSVMFWYFIFCHKVIEVLIAMTRGQEMRDSHFIVIHSFTPLISAAIRWCHVLLTPSFRNIP